MLYEQLNLFKKMIGYVYILVNSAFPNLVKIGRTTKDSASRADELSSTGSPSKFVVAYDQLVSDCIMVEYLLHDHFNEQRYSKNREFFEIDSKTAILKLIEISNQFQCDDTETFANTPFDYFSNPTSHYFLYLVQIGQANKKDVFYRYGSTFQDSNEFTKKSISELKEKLVKFYKLNEFRNYYSHEIELLEFSEVIHANRNFQKKASEIIQETLQNIINKQDTNATFNGWKTLNFDKQSIFYFDFEKCLGHAQFFYYSIKDELTKVREAHDNARALSDEEAEKNSILEELKNLGDNF